MSDNIKSFGAEVFAKPAKVGMEVPPSDNFYWNVNNSKGITVWIALISVQKNGAYFITKSQKLD